MQRLTTIKLRRVQFIPRELEPGILYVSEKYRSAVHLCACGCGSKVSTPLTPTEWSLTEKDGEPSLEPSVGNWQFCRSHYWIHRGEIVWSHEWTEEQITSGRKAEEERRIEYYESRQPIDAAWYLRLWSWIKRLCCRL